MKKGLYANINARKAAGTSRPKVYSAMKAKRGGFKDK